MSIYLTVSSSTYSFSRKSIILSETKEHATLTLLNPVGVPKHWGGYAFSYRMATEPPCMPAKIEMDANDNSQ